MIKSIKFYSLNKRLYCKLWYLGSFVAVKFNKNNTLSIQWGEFQLVSFMKLNKITIFKNDIYYVYDHFRDKWNEFAIKKQEVKKLLKDVTFKNKFNELI